MKIKSERRVYVAKNGSLKIGTMTVMEETHDKIYGLVILSVSSSKSKFKKRYLLHF